MSALFDGLRFGRLWRAHWAENWREYAWFAGVAAMVDLIFIIIYFSADSSDRSFRTFQFDGQITWYTIGLFLSSLVFAARHFKHLASPGSALIALMRPGSHVEKCLLTFLVVSVLYPLVYTLAYSVLNFPVVQLAKALYVAPACKACVPPAAPDFSFFIPFLTAGIPINTDSAPPFSFFKPQVFVMLGLWTWQALIVGGTVFFKRSPVLRTVLLLFLLTISLVWLGGPKMGAFWSGTDDELIPYTALESGLALAQWLGLPTLAWLAVFFHIKERELS